MGGQEKSIANINEKIKHGTAVVLTDTEFMEKIQKGVELNLGDIDVITTAFYAETSGTAAMIGVPVAERGAFTRAKKLWLNGVLGYPGPAPNERLGLVEGLFFSSKMSNNRQGNYSGAHLIKDVIRREEIQVACLSVEGDTYRTTFTLDQADFARMYVYNCFFRKLCSGSKASSRDSHLKTIRAGSKILLNKSPGIVIGCGTRSTPEDRALSLAADMFGMDPGDIKELETETGTTITNSVALAIPVLTEEILKDLADCLVTERQQEYEANRHQENGMAEYLKQIIKKGDFLLSSSDINLNYWFNG
ncbi:MAG: homocysteine biosynthesis protein [Pseudomonadota bacterium]